jgi:NADH-quinone oxidoreductase subunit A
MEDSQLIQYIPVLILMVVAFAIAFGMLVASVVIGRIANRNRKLAQAARVKNTPYECGMLPVGEGSSRLSVKFYLVAMLFILFDIEVVFLYPWAVVYRAMLKDPATAGMIFGSMLTFMAVLFVGYIYALKKRALDWK